MKASLPLCICRIASPRRLPSRSASALVQQQRSLHAFTNTRTLRFAFAPSSPALKKKTVLATDDEFAEFEEDVFDDDLDASLLPSASPSLSSSRPPRSERFATALTAFTTALSVPSHALRSSTPSPKLLRNVLYEAGKDDKETLLDAVQLWKSKGVELGPELQKKVVGRFLRFGDAGAAVHVLSDPARYGVELGNVELWDVYEALQEEEGALSLHAKLVALERFHAEGEPVFGMFSALVSAVMKRNRGATERWLTELKAVEEKSVLEVGEDLRVTLEELSEAKEGLEESEKQWAKALLSKLGPASKA